MKETDSNYLRAECPSCEKEVNIKLTSDQAAQFTPVERDIKYGNVDIGDEEFKNVRTYNFDRKKFEEVARPLIKYLNDNHHPMTKIIIETDSAEVVEGCMSFVTKEYIKD